MADLTKSGGVKTPVFLLSVLPLLERADEREVIATVPWSSVLLICGMCMLIGVVQQAGGMDLLTSVLKTMINRFTVKLRRKQTVLFL